MEMHPKSKENIIIPFNIDKGEIKGYNNFHTYTLTLSYV